MNSTPVPIGESLVDDSAQPMQFERSFLHYMLDSSQNNQVLLIGPHTTSLAMDMAHTIATQWRCSTCTTSCQCSAVDFLICDDGQELAFPLYCQETSNNQHDLQSKLRTLEQFDKKWDARALKRIRIHHFRSKHSLFSFLLKMKTAGTIILDRIDKFVHSTSGLSLEESMEMTQILAILADTRRALLREGTQSSLSVLVTMHASLPKHVERLIRTWFPQVVTVAATDKPMSSYMLASPQDTIRSSWIANLDEDGSKKQVNFSVVHGASDGTNRIVWSRDTQDGYNICK